jgi:TolA-binding protein
MRTLRFTPLLAGLVLMSLAIRLTAQESSEAVAARRETESNLKALSARVEELEASNHSLRVRLDDMRREVQQLREEMRKLADQSGTQEQLRKLADSVKEVDSKRRADNEKVLNELSKLARQMAETPVAPPPAPRATPSPGGGEIRPPHPPSGDKGSEKGIEYVIKSGDTLSGIVTACRGQNLKVTQKLLMEANPDVNWNRLKVGQKIFIPLPNS